MSEEKRSRRQKNTIFYALLFLGMTAVAVAGYRAILPETTVPVAEPIEVTTPPETIPETPPVISERARPVHSVVEITVPEETVSASAPRMVEPLEGETIAVFSMQELAYSETLGDWRTHNGVDIAAETGAQVFAACSGTVLSVREDDLMGTSIVVEHEGGYETTYANLQPTPPVMVGDYVSAGQMIGTVGRTSLAESSLPPHLHFAVAKDGAAIDPDAFLREARQTAAEQEAERMIEE